MAFDFDKSTTRKDAVIRLLILAILSLTLFPHHYHHHVAEPSVQILDRDLHPTGVHAHSTVEAIAHDEDSDVIKSVADAPLKGQNAKAGWVIMALMVFLLCLAFVPQAAGVHPQPCGFRLPRFDRRKMPPLRAPPAV